MYALYFSGSENSLLLYIFFAIYSFIYLDRSSSKIRLKWYSFIVMKNLLFNGLF